MRVNRDLFHVNINQFPRLSWLISVYCDQAKNSSCHGLDYHKLVNVGLDYVLSNSSPVRQGVAELHFFLREKQLYVLHELAKIIGGRYPVVLAQSLAYSFVDQRAALNGYKSDIDVMLHGEDREQFKHDLASAGHVRRVIDTETGNTLQLASDDIIDAVFGKEMAGSFLIPVDLSAFNPSVCANFLRLAGRHMPLNLDEAGQPYLLFGIDAIFSYGPKPVDLSLSTFIPAAPLPIQDPSYNAAVAIQRLYSTVSEGILKPNLIFLISCMLMQGNIIDIQNHLSEEYKRFFCSFILFHLPIYNSNTNIVGLIDEILYYADRETMKTLSELYASLDEYIESQDV